MSRFAPLNNRMMGGILSEGGGDISFWVGSNFSSPPPLPLPPPSLPSSSPYPSSSSSSSVSDEYLCLFTPPLEGGESGLSCGAIKVFIIMLCREIEEMVKERKGRIITTHSRENSSNFVVRNVSLRRSTSKFLREKISDTQLGNTNGRWLLREMLHQHSVPIILDRMADISRTGEAA